MGIGMADPLHDLWIAANHLRNAERDGVSSLQFYESFDLRFARLCNKDQEPVSRLIVILPQLLKLFSGLDAGMLPRRLAELVPFSVICAECDAGDEIHTRGEADRAGWSEVVFTPELPNTNYVGLCPTCRDRRDGSWTRPHTG